jgi:hypothetical protein
VLDAAPAGGTGNPILCRKGVCGHLQGPRGVARPRFAGDALSPAKLAENQVCFCNDTAALELVDRAALDRQGRSVRAQDTPPRVFRSNGSPTT